MYMDFEIFFGFNEAWNENIAVALFRTHEWHTVAASCQTFIYVHKFDKTVFVYGWREYEIRNRLFVLKLRFIKTIFKFISIFALLLSAKKYDHKKKSICILISITLMKTLHMPT